MQGGGGGGGGWACTKCREPLGGSAFRALGRGYHLRCFACAACGTPLPDGRFFASKPVPPATDQIPLCDRCYGNMYLQKCATCGDYITTKEAVVACGKRFHPEHFVCALCKCPLGAKFYPHDGMPYCRQDIDRVTGRVADVSRRQAPLDPQPPFSPAPVAPASSPVFTPPALAASPMPSQQNGGSSSTADLAAAARRLMPPPSSSRPMIPTAGNGDASPSPQASVTAEGPAQTRSTRHQLPNPHAASSRSSSNIPLPPRPLKSLAPALSRSQPDAIRQQVTSPAGARFRAQTQVAEASTVAAGGGQTRERPSVSSPPQVLAGTSPALPRKSFDDPSSSRPSVFDLGLVTPRSPNARIRVRPEDGRILPQRNRRASLDKALERSDSKTCLQCLQQFAALSPGEYGSEQCARCENQRKRSSSTALAPVVLESVDDYDLWVEQDKLAKLQWPKNAVEDESLVRSCGYPRELGSREVAPQDVDYRHIERAAPYYKQFLYSQEHDTYLVGLEESKEPGILSVETTSSKRVGKQFLYRALLRTARGDERFLVQGSKNGKKKPKVSHIRRSHDALRRENVPLVSVSDKSITNDLVHFEERMRNKRFKIGVLYARPGQTTEDEFYGNETGSKAFDDFLLLLGEKVELKSHTRFAGGLQTKEGAATGEYSIYTEFQGLEVMFHVATYIPFTPEDRQQVERKRHLGNDIVVIVFRDGTDGSGGFSAANISSHFNHTFVVVEPVPGSAPLAYKVGLVYKSGVRPSKPFLPYPPTFQADEAFRQWMLTKLINAEISSLHSPEFLSVLRRTRRELLREIVERYDAKLLKA